MGVYREGTAGLGVAGAGVRGTTFTCRPRDLSGRLSGDVVADRCDRCGRRDGLFQQFDLVHQIEEAAERLPVRPAGLHADELVVQWPVVGVAILRVKRVDDRHSGGAAALAAGGLPVRGADRTVVQGHHGRLVPQVLLAVAAGMSFTPRLEVAEALAELRLELLEGSSHVPLVRQQVVALEAGDLALLVQSDDPLSQGGLAIGQFTHLPFLVVSPLRVFLTWEQLIIA